MKNDYPHVPDNEAAGVGYMRIIIKRYMHETPLRARIRLPVARNGQKRHSGFSAMYILAYST